MAADLRTPAETRFSTPSTVPDGVQLEFLEAEGLGSQKYNLVEVE